MKHDPRFTRQVRLAEVGEAGQARLGRVRARLSTDGAAAWVESRYLQRAGVAVADPSAMTASKGAEDAAFPPWIEALLPASRDVAKGAYGALEVVRAVIADCPHARVEPLGRSE